MSVQDIVKYVRQTPGNTNPAVIASMVESEIRQNSLDSKVKSDWAENNPESPSYVKNRTHYDSRETFTFDGNLAGKTTAFDIGLPFVKVSDTVLYENDLIGAIATLKTSEAEIVYNFNKDSVFSEELMVVALVGEDTPGIISIFEDMEQDGFIFGKGLYFIYIDETSYINKLSTGEIHKLDDKYIPESIINILSSIEEENNKTYKLIKKIETVEGQKDILIAPNLTDFILFVTSPVSTSVNPWVLTAYQDNVYKAFMQFGATSDKEMFTKIYFNNDKGLGKCGYISPKQANNIVEPSLCHESVSYIDGSIPWSKVLIRRQNEVPFEAGTVIELWGLT